MFSWQQPKDRVAIVQMNADLRHAQLELLSAQCATDRLRLRFSSEDLARFAQQDVLDKAIRAASALHTYYSSVDSQRSKASIPAPCPGNQMSEEEIEDAVTRISMYLRQQRDKYFPVGDRLPDSEKLKLQSFFCSALLDQVRVLEMNGARIPNPPFFEEGRARGLHLPEMRHMASLTFVDVVVFNDKLSARALFHGLVHAVQFLVLGLEQYVDLFVRAFLKTRFHATVPLEAQAFLLESRFLDNQAKGFSVEEQVRLWAEESRY